MTAIDAPRSALTVEDLKQCTQQLELHMKLHKGGVHFAYRCIQHPRLQVIKHRASRQAQMVRLYYVDGKPVRTLAEACAALNRTPLENELMPDQLPLQDGAGVKKWTLADGIAEAKRELGLRAHVYPTFIARGSLTVAEANKQNRDMQGTLRFLEFCLEHERRLRELVDEFMAQEKRGEAS